MIKKLDIMNSGINVIDRLGFTQNVPDAKIYCNKINEIIDIINAIVVDVDGTKCVDGSKAPADNSEKANRQENVQKIDIGELAYLQKENSDLKDEVEKLQKQLAEWQKANVSLIKDSAICNTYTHIRWDELCRLREIADKYAEITGHKGVQNE